MPPTLGWNGRGHLHIHLTVEVSLCVAADPRLVLWQMAEVWSGACQGGMSQHLP